MKKQLLILLSIFFSIGLFSQSYTIKGVVFNEIGEPMIGVIISQKGTTNGAVSNVYGRFSLTLPDDGKTQILEFRFFGMQVQELKVGKADAAKELKVVMKEDVATLDEVVVVGYSTVKKSSMTGAVSSISGRTPGIVMSAPSFQSGLLTAGEVNDYAKWALWGDIMKKSHASHISTWKVKPSNRYTVQLSNKNNMPIVDAVVSLIDKKGNAAWKTRTDNTGKAELWLNLFDDGSSKGDYKIVCEYQGKKSDSKKAIPFEKGINSIKMDVACNDDNKADIMFIVDATGSMGDEIRYLQAELADVIQRVKTSQPDLAIRMGSVFYRDKGDDYLTRLSALDSNIKTTLDFMDKQSAGGGGDTPEAVDEALEEAFKNGGWNENALARIAFLVLDASCHTDEGSIKRMHEQIKIAAEKGIRIIPVVCSGMYQDGEYLMRAMALATNGTTLFLTDDSGIGDTHLKPTTDKMEVEKLNDMIVRLIVQYTKMPDCANDNWVEEDKKEAETDKFVPDPYDASDVETKNKSEEEEKGKEEPVLANNDVIVAYPNPCTDVLQVKILKDVDDLFLIDISGKSLQRFKNQKEGSATSVNVSRYAAGIYFVKAFHNKKWYVQKIIVRGY